MNTSPAETKGPAQPRFGRLDLAMDRVRDGIRRSVDWLLGQQDEDGYWCGELEADSMLESDYIFMHTLLGTGDPGRMERAVNEILRHQNEDGGWSLYPGGPSNLNYGVKCYLALKLIPLPNAETGKWPIKDVPFHFTKAMVDQGGPIGRASPCYGEDNDYVYGELLKMPAQERAELEKEGVI